MTSDPFGVSISTTNGNLGVDMACIQFKAFWHLDIVPLVLEVDGEFVNLVMEAVIVLCEFWDSDAEEDFSVMDSGDKAIGDGADHVIEVLLGRQCYEGCLGWYWGEPRFNVDGIVASAERNGECGRVQWHGCGQFIGLVDELIGHGMGDAQVVSMGGPVSEEDSIVGVNEGGAI